MFPIKPVKPIVPNIPIKPVKPIRPEKLTRVICGARNRKGGSCKVWSVAGKKRCRFHGGLSTGPKTQAGRDRIRAAQLQRWSAPAGESLNHTIAKALSRADDLAKVC